MNKKKIDELYELAIKNKQKTFLSIIGNPYSENLISDCLAFMFDKDQNGAGVAPLNALLKCANPNYEVDELDTITIKREHCFDKKSRIDILIYVVPHGTKKPFYIGIENKIGATEGENQTIRYADFLFEKNTNYTKNGEENIGIFLTQSGEDAESHHFKNISYRDLLDEFEIIESNNLYFEDFKTHIKTYISPNSFSAEDLAFISSFDSDSFKKNCTSEMIKNYIAKNLSNDNSDNCNLAERIFDYICILRDIFFNIVEQELKKFFQSEDYEGYIIEKKNKKSFYIQFYKKEWKENGNDIHFEIIIPYHKGILFPDAELFIMLHKEKGNKNINELRNRLKENYNTDTANLGFNKNTAVCGKTYQIQSILEGNITNNVEAMLNDFNNEFNISEISGTVNDHLKKNI